MHTGTLGSPTSTFTVIPTSAITFSYDALTTVWTACFQVDSFSTFYAHTANPLGAALPVSLLYFNGKKVNGTTELEWSTTSEQNNHHFVIERSLDSKKFSGISADIPTKALNGNSSAKLDYQFTDLHPTNGHNYYRMKQVDINHQFGYSNLIDIYFSNDATVTLYPNPVTTELMISLNTPHSGNAIVKVMDATGKLVRSMQFPVQPGNNKAALDLQSLSDGMYLIRVDDLSGLLYTQTIRKK